MTYKEIYKAYKTGNKPNTKDIPLESFFQKKIIDYLRTLPDCFYWKAQAGAYSKRGVPDVCCIYRGTFYGFEVKRPWIGRLSKLQQQAIRGINDAGGKAYVVSFVEDVEKIMGGRSWLR